jgi:hypothetical protein
MVTTLDKVANAVRHAVGGTKATKVDLELPTPGSRRLDEDDRALIPALQRATSLILERALNTGKGDLIEIRHQLNEACGRAIFASNARSARTRNRRKLASDLRKAVAGHSHLIIDDGNRETWLRQLRDTGIPRLDALRVEIETTLGDAGARRSVPASLPNSLADRIDAWLPPAA